MSERNLSVGLSGDAKAWLLEEAGIDPSTGARPLRRVLQRHIQDPVSEILIAQQGRAVETIEVGVEEGKLSFNPTFHEVLTETT